MSRANEILKLASGTRPQFEAMKRFIEQHRGTYEVESIRKVLQMATLCYW